MNKLQSVRPLGNNDFQFILASVICCIRFFLVENNFLLDILLFFCFDIYSLKFNWFWYYPESSKPIFLYKELGPDCLESTILKITDKNL